MAKILRIVTKCVRCDAILSKHDATEKALEWAYRDMEREQWDNSAPIVRRDGNSIVYYYDRPCSKCLRIEAYIMATQ